MAGGAGFASNLGKDEEKLWDKRSGLWRNTMRLDERRRKDERGNHNDIVHTEESFPNPAETAALFAPVFIIIMSSSYRKALKQYKRSTANRQPVENDWTPFRAAEKKYKARFPPVDLSQVLTIDDCIDVSAESGPKAYTVPQIPGEPHGLGIRQG